MSADTICDVLNLDVDERAQMMEDKSETPSHYDTYKNRVIVSQHIWVSQLTDAKNLTLVLPDYNPETLHYKV